MMLKVRLFLIVLLSITLAGCNKSAPERLIGKWKFKKLDAISKDLGVNMEMIFEFKSDQTGNFTTTGLLPFAGPITWKTLETKGNNLTIEITNPKEKIPGKVQITFTDNDHILFSPPGSMGKSMEFEREKEL
jgi:hypothetical protein